MAEAAALSPNNLKQRAPFSPSSPFFLGSNDDKLERAQARAARAAAIRRKQPAFGPPPPDAASANDSFLDQRQILELFHNCIKLASENKINQKNTWELNLIDHLYEIIKVEEENDADTNFQKASCTLEAGVKIYSMRVDSVHSEAYKVLGGINRVGQENEQDNALEDANDNNRQEEGHAKKDQEKKLSPVSTLESSFESLNVKKFDAAFAVDPLYHQTSAQFDEGGAKGLLFNNLGIYGNCQVLFDSLEVPGKCMLSSTERDTSVTIDISFARECIGQMLNMPNKDEISPSLQDVVNHLDEDNRRPPEPYASGHESLSQVDGGNEDNFGLDNNGFENRGTWDFNQDDQASTVDEGPYYGEPTSPCQHEENEPFVFQEHDLDDSSEKIDDYLFFSLGFSSKQNAWAGPDHWKYQKTKDPENPEKETASPLKTKKTKNRKVESDIDFTKALDIDMSIVFAPPKNPKSLLLPASKAPRNTRLPEDCHYQPEDLVKLFLLPTVMCLGKKRRKFPGPHEPSAQGDYDGPMPSWDDDGGFDGSFDNENDYGDVKDSNTLVSQPRQVNKIEVQYDKTSKQVDVQALKETLWYHIRETNTESVQEKTQDENISFKKVLANFPNDCKAAGSVKEISPHLCFICLLHLANEHGLRIQGHANLDDLAIYI